MRILFSQTYYLPYISGLTIYTQRLAEGLLKKGHQVTVLTSQHQKNLKKNELKQGIRILRVPYLVKFHKGLFMPSWPLVCLDEVKKADVVICNLPQAEGIWPVFWGKILRKKTVAIYTCEVVLPEGSVNKLVEKFLFWSNFLTCLFADKVVAYTQDYADNTQLLPRFKNKLVPILPPVALAKEDQATTRQIRKKIQKKKRETIIGFAARISAEKGLEYLLEALPFLERKLYPVKLAIAGPKKEVIGEAGYFRKISSLTCQLGSKVIFLGTLLPEQMSSFYKMIDILVLPSINSTEAFGMVQVEAMLSGTPVVASDLPGVRMPIRLTGMGELVPIKNPEKIAEAILKILKNKKKYLKPKHEIEKIFSFQKTIKAYEKILV